MLEYKFYKIEDNYRIDVKKPYHFLGDLTSEGELSSDELNEIIEGIEKVKNGELEDYSFENQAGFMAYVIAPDSTQAEFPEGGVQILDFFNTTEDDIVEPLYIIPFQEILKFLNEFKGFLVKNGK